MDSFQGNESITIQPGDINVPVSFRMVAASASTKNDGSMPYGSTLISATVLAHSANGTATTSLVANSTETGNTIVAYLSYSSALAASLYHVTVTATFSISGSTLVMAREYDFNRVFVKDR